MPAPAPRATVELPRALVLGLGAGLLLALLAVAFLLGRLSARPAATGTTVGSGSGASGIWRRTGGRLAGPDQRPRGIPVVLASPDGTADGNWKPE